LFDGLGLLLGVLSAIVDVLTRREVETFRVTPKGENTVALIPIQALAPYGAVSLVSGLSVLMMKDISGVAGYGLFASINSLLYAGLLLLVLCLHIRENS
jgi:hypothetical protein